MNCDYDGHVVIEIKGEVCHEMVQDVPYLEQFISEVLRMLSPGVRYAPQLIKHFH